MAWVLSTTPQTKEEQILERLCVDGVIRVCAGWRCAGCCPNENIVEMPDFKLPADSRPSCRRHGAMVRVELGLYVGAVPVLK